MTRAQIGGLAAALVVVIALGSHVTRWSGTAGLLIPALVLAAAVVCLGRRFVFVGRTHRMAIHTHGGHGTWTAAKHEAGHYHTAFAVGGHASSAQIFPDGSGVTWVDVPCKAGPAAAVAVAVAGQVASGTKAGCDYGPGSDFHYKRQILRSLPAADRSRVEREGYALATRACKGLFSPVPSLARRIYRNGTI